MKLQVEMSLQDHCSPENFLWALAQLQGGAAGACTAPEGGFSLLCPRQALNKQLLAHNNLSELGS